VVGFMFVLAIVNLALGYAAAMALAEPPLWSGWRFRLLSMRNKDAGNAVLPQPVEADKPAATPAAVATESVDAGLELPTVAGLEELPADWLERYLAGIQAVTPQEVLDVFRREVHPERMTILVVGNPATFDAPLETLGPVTVLTP